MVREREPERVQEKSVPGGWTEGAKGLVARPPQSLAEPELVTFCAPVRPPITAPREHRLPEAAAGR